MSGGSYDYLCSKSAEDLIVDFNVKKQLDNMIARLDELGFDDVSLASKMLKKDYNDIEAILVKMQERIDKLSSVWRNVEWFDSSDYDLEHVTKSVEKFRKNNS